MFHRLSLRSKFISIVGCVIVVALSTIFYWMYENSRRAIIAQLDAQAKSLLTQLLLTRKWVASQKGGGVYVGSDPNVSSSPYVSHLDIADKNGRPYYFRNPALVSRELSELAENEGLYRFHLTSLNLKNPDNEPSDFERESLLIFENNGYDNSKEGRTRTFTKNGSAYFERVIPLRTENNCLKCHAGYKAGDIRGSLSVTIPLEQAHAAIRESRNFLLLSGFGFTFIVLLILFIATWYIVLKPVHHMYLTAQKVEADKYFYEADFNVKTGDELETLADAFREMLSRISETYEGSVRALANAIEARDPYTKGHTERVAFYSASIARELGCDEATIKSVELGAILHDIGKIGVSDAVLRKPTNLIEKEVDEMHQHPLTGAKIMHGSTLLLREIPGVLYHHEKFDGSGYPNHLKGNKIPLEARIIAVSDAFDAMTTDRPYRKALEVDTALSEINKGRNTQFDPDVVAVFDKIARRLHNEAWKQQA